MVLQQREREVMGMLEQYKNLNRYGTLLHRHDTVRELPVGNGYVQDMVSVLTYKSIHQVQYVVLMINGDVISVTEEGAI